MTLTSFTHIAYEADDDSYNDLNLYWDDISIWNQPVSTVPDHIVQFSIGEIEPVSFSLKITCVDIDGFRIPNAHVYISNGSSPYLNQDDFSNPNGDVLFVNVSRTDYYNITVNYTMQGVSAPLTETVATLNNYKPPGLHSEKIITLELWTVNFNITDIDGNPVEYGFITLENNTLLGTDIVGNATLNSNGETQIIWRNQSSYNFSVYFNYGAMPDEAVYHTDHLEIYNGNVSRINTNGPRYIQHTIDVKDPAVTNYSVGNDEQVIYEWIPSNYSRIASYNISFINMTNYIKNYNIKDENGTIIETYSDYSGVNAYINYSAQYNNTNLGKIRVELLKAGAALENPKNGTFYITYVKSTKENVQVNISTVHFTVLDTNEEKLENAIIRIYNNTTSPKVSIANLTVQEDGTSRFIYFTYGGIYNQGNYSMVVYFAGQNRNINKTYYNFTDDTTDWIANKTEGLNFTLISETWNTTVVQVNILEWTTKIENIYSTTTTVYWRDHIFVRVNFSAKGESTEATWIKYAIVDNDFSEITDYVDLENEPDIGIYNLTFDTSNLSGGQNYFVKVIAGKSGYSNPDYLAVSFSPLEVLTDIQIYNYTSWQPYPSNNITKYWGETLYLTVRYFEQTTGGLIGDAGVSMKWNFGDDIMLQDPSKAAGFYTIFFDTSEAPTIGKYLLEFSADKGNFSASTENFFINIINRPTTINNKTQLDRIYKEIYVEDPYNFTFTFRDNLTGGTLTDLDSHYYIWELYDEEGNVTESGSGFLNETGTGSHVLDFATENRTVGDFLLFVTLDKNNYDYATALISLKIKLREITSDLVGVEGSQINSIQGDVVTIKFKLTDPTRNNINLTGAYVNLTIGDTIYAFTDDDGDGVYEYDFTTAEINAFIMAQTLTGQIKYWAPNHINYTMEVTIVVGMPEIFPGMPTFYFILILAIVIVGVGGIVGYRVVQQARIPAFVKKTRSMAKSMKGGKSISASIKIPTKEDYIVDTLKSYWEKLGLSIEDTLGIKGKKLEEIKKESIEVEEKPSEPEIEYPEVEEEPSEPEIEYPEVEEEPSEPEMEYPEPEKEPSEPEREPSEIEKEPPETKKEYDENQEGGSEE